MKHYGNLADRINVSNLLYSLLGRKSEHNFGDTAEQEKARIEHA